MVLLPYSKAICESETSCQMNRSKVPNVDSDRNEARVIKSIVEMDWRTIWKNRSKNILSSHVLVEKSQWGVTHIFQFRYLRLFREIGYWGLKYLFLYVPIRNLGLAEWTAADYAQY